MYIDKLKYLRDRNNITQQELANVIGITGKSYGHYENEDDIIPIKHLITICDYFDVSIDYIFGFTDKMNYDDSRKIIDKKLIGLRIKEFRKDYKLTQLKLASILNIASGTIAEYERGTNIIATPFLYTICKKYNVSADYLLGRIDYPKHL